MWRRIRPCPACNQGNSTRALSCFPSRNRQQREWRGCTLRSCTPSWNTLDRKDCSRRPICKRPLLLRTGRRGRFHCPCPRWPSSSVSCRDRGSSLSWNRFEDAPSLSRTYDCCSSRWRLSKCCHLNVGEEPDRGRLFWCSPCSRLGVEQLCNLDRKSRRKRGWLSRLRRIRRWIPSRLGCSRIPRIANGTWETSDRSVPRFL